MKPNYILLIAHARSGSTLLCKLLSSLSDSHVYLEIFHHSLGEIRRALGDDADVVLANYATEGQDLRSELANQPMKYLEHVADRNANGMFLFKTFNGHVKGEALKEVILGSAGVLVLSRNLLHSFISNEIAVAKQRWGGVDTSADLIEFVPAQFVRYARDIMNFITTSVEIAKANQVPTAQSSYEAIATVDEGEKRVLDLMDALSIPRKPESVDAHREVPIKQDNRQLARDKVKNPLELLAFLDQIAMPFADDGAVAMDLDALKSGLAHWKP